MLGLLLWPLSTLLAATEQLMGPGGAIIALTLLVRLALLPLALRQALGLWKLRALAPTVSQLLERFPDQAEQRERLISLYRRHRVSPFGPALLLIPQGLVFLGLYHVIATEAIGQASAFDGFIGTLAAPVWGQPGAWVLLLVAAAAFDCSVLVSSRRAGVDAFGWFSRITLIFVPLGMIASAYYLPAGLAIYLAVTSLFGLAQAAWFARLTRGEAPLEDVSDLLGPVPAA